MTIPSHDIYASLPTALSYFPICPVKVEIHGKELGARRSNAEEKAEGEPSVSQLPVVLGQRLSRLGVPDSNESQVRGANPKGSGCHKGTISQTLIHFQ